jgi:superfamily II DNA or RNA helicase
MVQISKADDDTGRVERRHARVGDRVRVRRQRWAIADVISYEDCALLTLTGLGPANLGSDLRVLTPIELVEPIAQRRSLRVVRPARWRRACRELIAHSGPAGILRSARTARIDVMPHQLEPALALVRGLAARILIADDVGLGKTVQAALAVAELKARGAAARVLVLAPPGLREQWTHELAHRFDLTFALYDMAGIARQRARLPIGVNPWSIEPLIVTSIDFIKRREVLPAVRACHWDVVIVDEAHHVTSGTDRHEAVAALCRLSPYVLLLTATPHNGDPEAYAALCAIGRHDGDRLLVFRRTRQDVGLPVERRVHRLLVRPTTAERHMHDCLAAFVRAVELERDGRDPDVWLALSTLRKRAFSGAWALSRSVERRLLALSGPDNGAEHQLTLPLDDLAGECDAADVAPTWTVPSLQNPDQERTLLARLADAADQASRRESKLAALDRLLRRVGEPALVFTEYRDTLLHVHDLVAPQAAIIHGGLSRVERQAALTRFEHGGVLLATDAAGEGLNLHRSCRIVVNLELPWNPMRLEQRIGRVDRIGQRRRVHAFHLIAARTAETDLLKRLASRVSRAQTEAGASDPLHSASTGPNDPTAGPHSGALDLEAKAERDRVMFARQVMGDADTNLETACLHAAHPLATLSKRCRTRLWLRPNALVIFQSYLLDGTGRIAAVHLTPAIIRADNGVRLALGQLDQLGPLLGGDAPYNEWIGRSRAVLNAFWNTRVDRDVGIARLRCHVEHDELQGGLFDRRAEDDRISRVERRRDAAAEGEWRIAVAVQGAAASVRPLQPALILIS